jgi:uncharacterized membrane protein
MDALDIAKHEAINKSSWVGGGWWNVEVEVLWLFIEGGNNSVIIDGKSHVHIITSVG